MLVLLAACTTEKAEPANDLDESRRADLVAALWFVPSGSSAGGPVVGPGRSYERPGVHWFSRTPGTATEIVERQVAEARAAGWVPIYGECAHLVSGETDDGEAFVRADEITVHLARTQPDGSPAYAELVARSDRRRDGEILVDAHTMYHLDSATPAPVEEAPLAALLCFGHDDGREVVGAEMPLVEKGHVDKQAWE